MKCLKSNNWMFLRPLILNLTYPGEIPILLKQMHWTQTFLSLLLQPHKHVERGRRFSLFYLTQELEGLLDFYSATSCFQGLFVTLSYSIYIFIISFDNHFYHIHFMLCELYCWKWQLINVSIVLLELCS